MEIFQTIWNALTTPNEGLINIFGIPFIFIEMTVTTLLFTQVLNISSGKKQKLLYISLLSIWSILCNMFIPKQFTLFLNMIIYAISIILIFKIKILKGIFAAILPYTIIVLLDSFFAKLLPVCFNITREQATLIPIFREPIVLFNYLVVYVLYRLAKHLNFNISVLDNIDTKSRLIIFTNFILVILSIGTQFFIIGFYNEVLPVLIVFLSIFSLIIYFLLSIFTLTRTTQLQIANQNLEEAQLYNKSLKILHDNVRAFKHDFGNIVQSIGRLYRFK